MGTRQSTNGVNRCGNCGSSDVTFDGSWLVCGYCHNRWNTAVLADELRLSEGIEHLVGTSVLTGAKNIDTSSLVTVKCDGCGAVVTINSETSLKATCHWCRHVLSLNHPIDNGAVPDAILPFFVTREGAMERMRPYIVRHASFTSRAYKAEVAAATIRAVYLPYLVADGNATVKLEGRGWVQGLGWVGGPGSRETDGTVYRTKEFTLQREADLLIDDLVIEARSTHTARNAAVSTTNIINAIQPFDVEHAVRFDANYITDSVAYEKRDVEVSDAVKTAADLFATMARGYVNQTLGAYTGGVRWETEQTSIKGTRWVSMLLPVWLFAYEERTASGPLMHYVAVNGRTGAIEGSVPTDDAGVRRSGMRWGWVAGVLCSAPGFGLALLSIPALAGWSRDRETALVGVAFVLTGSLLALPSVNIGKRVANWRRDNIRQVQRNAGARFKPEFETRYTPTRLDLDDRFLVEFVHSGGPEIERRNDHRPQDRVTGSPHAAGKPPRPAEGGAATSGFVWDPQRVVRVDRDGEPVAGQAMSAPPPGPGPTLLAKLPPGMR